jgi:homoserine kinase
LPKRVTASCPSSIANVGPGFDIAALAIDAYHDFVSVTKRSGTGKVSVDEKTDEGFGAQNTAITSVKKLMEDKKVKTFDLSISLTKKVPIGVGLGSSGASAAGSVFAANRALELGLRKTELVKFAAYGEISAAGAPHADNVSAALMGGLACVFDAERDEVFSIGVPRNIVITVLLIRGADSKDKT